MNKGPFYSIKEFPYMEIIQSNWKVFRDELPYFNIDKKDSMMSRTQSAWNNKEADELVNKLNTNNNWVKGFFEDVEWYQYPLIYNGESIGNSHNVCPKSIELLKQIPCRVAGFSLLLPNTKLPIHIDNTGPSSHTMAVNMGLVSLDSRLYIKYNNQINIIKNGDGKLIIFNSELEHYAENNDLNDIRYILYIDFKTE